ncbi:hypothetical protein BGZ76_001232 [Entomortierella beljakovae]|nr:hypothetical protein BGZ76_001232 [Entomortierella beljakovae]
MTQRFPYPPQQYHHIPESEFYSSSDWNFTINPTPTHDTTSLRIDSREETAPKHKHRKTRVSSRSTAYEPTFLHPSKTFREHAYKLNLMRAEKIKVRALRVAAHNSIRNREDSSSTVEEPSTLLLSEPTSSYGTRQATLEYSLSKLEITPSTSDSQQQQEEGVTAFDSVEQSTTLENSLSKLKISSGSPTSPTTTPAVQRMTEAVFDLGEKSVGNHIKNILEMHKQNVEYYERYMIGCAPMFYSPSQIPDPDLVLFSDLLQIKCAYENMSTPQDVLDDSFFL